MSNITYCSRLDCAQLVCNRHQAFAPKDRHISIADFSSACKAYSKLYEKRNELLQAICYGTQNTAYHCNDVTKAMCGCDGTCAYCATIADAVERVIR